MVNYLYVIATLLLTVYGQIILKWRLKTFGTMPEDLRGKAGYLWRAFFDPFIFSGLFAAFLASVCWLIAMTKLEITRAYPLMSLAPAIVFMIGIYYFGETFTPGKVIGLLLIIAGTIATVRF